MEVPRTDKFIKEGIKMRKLLAAGSYGLFSSSEPTYDYKTVYDLEEALDLHANNGWSFVELESLFYNIALNLWRDLKSK